MNELRIVFIRKQSTGSRVKLQEFFLFFDTAVRTEHSFDADLVLPGIHPTQFSLAVGGELLHLSADVDGTAPELEIAGDHEFHGSYAGLSVYRCSEEAVAGVRNYFSYLLSRHEVLLWSENNTCLYREIQVWYSLRMTKRKVTTDSAPGAIGPYSQAVIIGSMVYTSGQIPRDPQSGELVTGSVEEQVRRVLDNLKAVIEAAGSDFSRVAKVLCFLEDMNTFSEFNVIYGEYFSEPYPARSCVEVARLPKDVAVEIEMIASL